MPTVIVSTTWTLESGPGTCVIADPSSLTTTVDQFSDPGDYVFRLTAVDNLSQSNFADCTVHVAGDFSITITNSLATAGISSVTGPTLTFTEGNTIPFSGLGDFKGTYTSYSGVLTVHTSGTIPAFPVGVFHARLKINGIPFGTVYPATNAGSYSWTVSINGTDLVEFTLAT